MAWFPCDVCHKKYRGASSALYPARLNGIDTVRKHLRLCPDDMAQLLDRLNPYLVADEGTYVQNNLRHDTCVSCNKLIQETADTVFVTAYPRSSDRLDYWMLLHRDCRTPVGLESLQI